MLSQKVIGKVRERAGREGRRGREEREEGERSEMGQGKRIRCLRNERALRSNCSMLGSSGRIS